MSTAALTQSKGQDHVIASIDSFASHQGAVTPSSRAILRLISCYDSATLDFSDWAPEHLDENTTSFSGGLQNGTLDIGCYNLSNDKLTDDVHATSLTADSEDHESGKTIICIHEWCVHQARAEHGYVPGQRFFRFEKGRYTSALPFPGLKVMQTAIKDFLTSVRGT
ncbi:hypothetical protein E0Z10_g7280 [Xylaria hypoxylon]|uniref:Uncharacterized protein n=1 Tax=Xylaria hypoxylon TaxID=37992 RepID=A0A4Z0YVJ1_9PEZI|nr:hypothetical protein E0Z10_g7280 [Xylaria hypoxylon]